MNLTTNNMFLCHRVKMVSQVNVVHRVLQDLLEREVGQVQLAQKVPRYPQTCLPSCCHVQHSVMPQNPPPLLFFSPLFLISFVNL